MNRTITIFLKEFRDYFNSPVAYVYLVFFLSSLNWLFFREFFFWNETSLGRLFSLLPWFFMFFIPAVSMKTWSEEKRSGTLEVLLTLPVSDFELIAGKFLASTAFVVLSLVLTFPAAITAGMLGNLDWGPVIGGYVAAFFMGAAFLSIGFFASSLTDNQIVAFILAIAMLFWMFFIGESVVTVMLPSRIASLFRYIGLNQHFASIARGVLDLRDIVYYVSLTFFFLFLNLHVLKSRH